MEFTGKNVDEAIELGLAEMGLDKDQAEITVVQEQVVGLFGRVKSKAIVNIEKKECKSEECKCSCKEEGAEALKVEDALEFIQKTCKYLEIDASAQIEEGEENPVIKLTADDSSSVIGFRGEVLDAMQTLASAVANIGNKSYRKVVVDCENYRDKREETLVSLAHKLEAKATDMRRKVILEPMKPFERRIIHTALAESQTVTTTSSGKEPNRYVVIVPNDLDEYSKPYNAGRNNDRKSGKSFGRNDRKGGRDNKRGGSGFSQRRSSGKSGFTEQKRKTSSGFGTYLGNSFKDN